MPPNNLVCLSVCLDMAVSPPPPPPSYTNQGLVAPDFLNHFVY